MPSRPRFISYLEAKHSRTRLIEPFNKRDIEITSYRPERKIHIRHRPRMTAVENYTAAREWPCSAVGGVGCGVDISAGVLPLGSRCGEGVAAPGGCKESEMRSAAAGEGGEGEEGGEHCVGFVLEVKYVCVAGRDKWSWKT
jgi:hypothetical protein